MSDAKVVAASRGFVCIRLLTYESKEEAEVLKSLFIGRSGDLENTTFAILTPEGKTIGRAGRSPEFAFETPEAMAESMGRTSAQYAGRKEAPRELPLMKDLRLALNVASCEGLPLVVSLASGKDERERMEALLDAAAWTPGIIGRFAYVSVVDSKAPAALTGVTRKSGFLVVQPDVYGTKGSILAELDPASSGKDLEQGLAKGRSLHKAPEKDPQTHQREGRRLGVHWETVIPDTDPGPGGGPPRKP